MNYRPKYKPAPDANHQNIIDAFKAHDGLHYGFPIRVSDTSKIGGEFLDLLVSVDVLTFEVEVKNPKRKWTLTDGEADRLKDPAGLKYIIETAGEVDYLMAVLADCALALHNAVKKCGTGL